MSASIVLKVAMARSQSEAGYGRARMDSESRRALSLDLGDTVEIAGKRSVVAKVFKCDPGDEGRGMLFIDGLTRTNAGVSVDENVTVSRCEPSPAELVVLAPNIPEGKAIRFEEGIEDVFLRGLLNRPLVEDTDIIVPNVSLMGNRSTFSVVQTQPKGPVIVHEGTRVVVRPGPRARAPSAARGVQVTYDDVGGLGDELRRIREMVELPLKHPELFERLGIGAPRGVLLYGPPGTGKTLVAEAVANESGASLYSVRGPEIIGQYYGQSEERLREIFKEAEENAPSIVFLDEIDSIAPNRDEAYGEVERRVVAQLLTLMDGLGDRGNVIVIGATNREDSIDPALRRPGRFDREIEIGVPGRRGRAEILAVHLRDMPVADDVTPERLAGMTQGFVGADLAALCREAAMQCLSSRMGEFDLDRPVPQELLESMRVSMADFEAALGDIEPSGMREVLVEIPKVTWADVGGLDGVRRRIEEVLVPEEGNRAYERLGVEPGRGILLYGPPGTGKTLIAKAVANESGTNFISVNGPEVASKWMGESERAIRQIFKRAKQMAPCIIFFDELDSIAPIRGMDDGSAWERVVAQLLTSMDGVESLRNVTVMGATNRPDMIDPALLRPGRFDQMILVGKPDAPARLGILRVHTRGMPLDGVDLEGVAAATDGYVGADLAAVCREAGLAAYREDPDADRVCQRHFDAALSAVGPSVSQADMEAYEALGRKIRRRRTGWDNVPFYGRSQVLGHVREVVAVPQGAVVLAHPHAARDAHAAPPGFKCQALGLGHQAPAEPAVLPVPVVGAYRGGAPEDLELPYRRRRAGVQPQAGVAYDAVPALEGQEVLRAAAGLVHQVPQLRGARVRRVLRAAGLPAADAPARPALGGHPGGHHLAYVALGYPRGDLRGGDVPLDPLYADILRHERLHVREERHGGILVVGGVLAGPPHVVHLRALDHQQGVELQHVRAVGRVVEQQAEALEVVPRRRAGQAGHYVVADLQPALPAVPGAPADLLRPVAPLHASQDRVVQDLDPELDAGCAHAHGAVYLLRGEHVGAGLHRHPDAAAAGALVQRLRLPQGLRVLAVEGVEAPLHEPLLVLGVAAGERAAHDDQVDLVGPVADLLQLPDAVRHLPPGVEPVPRGAPGCGLLAGVRLGGAVRRPSGAERAPAVGAVVRRRHHGHRRDAAGRAGRLLDEQREHRLADVPLGVREHQRVRRDGVQRVLLAEPELEFLEGVAVRDAPRPEGLDQVPGEALLRVSHRAPCRRRRASWSPPGRPRAGACRLWARP